MLYPADLLGHVLRQIGGAELLGQRQPHAEVGAQAQFGLALLQDEIHQVSTPGAVVVDDVGVAACHRDSRLVQGCAETGDRPAEVLVAGDLLAVKNFARADEIRDMLRERGITLKDTPQGVQIVKE